MYDELNKHVKGNHKVTLTSDIGGEEEVYHGYIVGLTDYYCCLWLVVDWHHDGFLIIPNKYITDIQYGEYEKAYHHILESEGCLGAVNKPDWLSIECYASALKSLKANCNVVSVESRLPDVDEFVVGKIKDVNNELVYLQGFDATATWQDGIYEIPLNDVTAVKFGDEYSSVFIKYVK